MDRPGRQGLGHDPAHADRLAAARAWASAHSRRRRHAGWQVRGLQPGRSALRLRPACRQTGNPAGRSRAVGTGHVDFVRSLAFNRQGDLLASGGFRTVKLWQRPRTRRQAASILDDVAGTFAINPAGSIAAYALPGRIALCDLVSGQQLRPWVSLPEACAFRRTVRVSAPAARTRPFASGK